MQCPSCQVDLKAEQYEGVEIDRCEKCKGTWLDTNELTKIINTKEKTFPPELINETLTTAYKGVPRDEQRSIEKCVKCSTAMEAA